MTVWTHEAAQLVPGQQGPEDPLVKYAGYSKAERDRLKAQKRDKLKTAMKRAGRWDRSYEQTLKAMDLGYLDVLLDHYEGSGDALIVA